MANPPVLIDTSIFIDHLRKQNKAKSILYHIVDGFVLHTSTVVEFELYAGATSEQKQSDVGLVLMHCTVMPLTSFVAQRAAGLYRQLRAANQLIEMRDILIAATALAYKLPLMTLNAKHFDRIPSLPLISPPEV